MAEDHQQPAGFCPHCQYPINPGVCPECGTDVSPDALVQSLASVRRHRAVRYGIMAAPLLLVCAIVVYVAKNDDWMEHVPTMLFMPFQADYNGDVCIELRRRFRSNQLTNDQAQSVLEHHIAEPILEIGKNNPPGVPVKITVRFQYRNDKFGVTPGSRSLSNLILRVDGNEVAPMSKRELELVYNGNPRSRDFSVWCPPLEEGRHQIALESDFVVEWENNNGNAIIHRQHARLKRDIAIKGSVFDHVALISSDAAAREMRNSVFVLFQPNAPQGPRLSFRQQIGLTFPIAGQVLVRRRGEVGFVRVGHLFLSNAFLRSATVRLDTLPDIRSAEWLAVRVIPDPDVAFLKHADKCFGGVLTWPRINASYDNGAVPRTSWFPSFPNQVVLNPTHGGSP